MQLLQWKDAYKYFENKGAQTFKVILQSKESLSGLWLCIEAGNRELQ